MSQAVVTDLQPVQLAEHGALGVTLPIQVECRAHDQAAALGDFGRREQRVELGADRHHEVRGPHRVGGGGVDQLLAFCQGALIGIDEAGALHQPQDDPLSRLGQLGIGEGVVVRGRLGQSGEQRGFGQVELGHGPAVEGLGGRLDAVGQAAVVGLVEIEGEDLVLGEPSREPPGEQQLAQLAAQAALTALFGAEQQVASYLLGDGASAGGGFEPPLLQAGGKVNP